MQQQTDTILDSVRALMDRSGLLSSHEAETSRLAVGIYRLLGRGAPVDLMTLARRLEMTSEDCRKAIGAIRPSAIDIDDDGRIVAFGGLSLAATAHRFRLADCELFTWCTFDAFFLPEILNQTAILETHCPVTKEAIVVDLAPTAVAAVSPQSAVMSMVAPERQAYVENLRGAFCSHVRLFRDPGAFESWAASRTDVAMLTLDAATELARERNRQRYPFLSSMG